MIRQIFSINAGRSGSHYLYTLFGHALNVASHHEPEPKMQGTEMAQWNNGNEQPLRKLVQVRLDQIRQVVAQGRVWFSANNAFIKGSGSILMEYLPAEETGVVVLTRDQKAIARSIVKNGWTVAGERAQVDKSNAWLLWPGLKRNMTPLCVSSDPFELALWYAREIEARGKQFMADHPKVRYYTVDVTELNRLEKCLEMFDFFGVQAAPSLKAAVGVPTNKGH